MNLILGSQSIGRKQVLEKAGYAFTIMAAGIDEKSIRSSDYRELPLLLARAKSDALLQKIHEPALLITSDQIVICDGQLREKPETRDQAREYLTSYSTYPAQTVTAVVVTNTSTGARAEGVDSATVYFRKIPGDIIERLVEEGTIMRAAGGFIVEHPLLHPYVERIEGRVDSVTGLPLGLTRRLMAEVGR